MPHTCSPAFKNHLQMPVTTLATIWKVVLKNGTVLGFTDHTRNLTFGGVLYRSATGYTPSAIDSSSQLNVDNLEIQAILNGDMVKEQDLLAGLWDGAEVQMSWINYMDLTMGRLIRKTGTLGQIQMKGTSFIAELRGLMQAYTQNIGDQYQPMCRADLGDSKCKVDMTPYTFTGTVTGIDATNRFVSDTSRTEAGPAGSKPITNVSRAQRAVVTCVGHGFGPGSNVFISGVQGVVQVGATDTTGEFWPGSYASINGYTYGIQVVDADNFSIPIDTRLASDDPTVGPKWELQYSAYISGGTAVAQGNAGYFARGLITFTSGDNAGLSMEIKSYTTGTMELQLPMPYEIKVGDTYTIKRGCGGRFIEDCKNTFNNVINFQGEPHLPGQDQLMATGSPTEAGP